MAVSEAHKKASYKYNASRDSITIRPERSKGAEIRAAAVASGKSLRSCVGSPFGLLATAPACCPARLLWPNLSMTECRCQA